MALYLGSIKQDLRVWLDGIAHKMRLSSVVIAPSINTGNYLLSSDNYILLDKNGLYLIPLVKGDK